MPEEPSLSNERPIFLLGTGRCGSTFQQMTLNRLPDVWIWGEHDGIIGQLLRWGENAQGSKLLGRFSFTTPVETVLDAPGAHFAGDATRLAWLNAFRPDDIDDILRSAITRLFSIGLPPGKKRWGFKEIRYGPQNRTAEHLLKLFPRAKIVHTLRHPLHNVESIVLTWHRVRLEGMPAQEMNREIEKLYTMQLARWKNCTSYYLELEQAHPASVRTSRIETFREDFPALAEFLEAEGANIELPSGRINASGKGRDPDRFERLFRVQRKRHLAEVSEIAQRAGYRLEEEPLAPPLASALP